MSVALEDIWDAPTTISSPRLRTTTSDDEDGSPRPTKRQRASQPLFDPDSDDDIHAARPSIPRTPSGVPDGLDALFDLDDDDDTRLVDLRPSLDEAQLRREAEARHGLSGKRKAPYTPHQVLPSSSPPRDSEDAAARWGGDGSKDKEGDGEKKRKVPLKMDETRLLGPDGFPALIKQTKGFKSKGKGHEQTDLNRLLQIYQFWTHKMYPKGQFRDTVNTVEKLCHSRRMHSALSVWRDEAKGLINGKPPPLDDDAEIPSDDDDVNIPRANALPSSRSSSPAPSSPTPAARMGRPVPSHPPTSGSEMDDDIDEMLREEEERAANARGTAGPAPVTGVAKTSVPLDDEMDDVDFWADLARGAGDPEVDLTLDEAPATKLASPGKLPDMSSSTVEMDDDFDMDEDAWQALNEVETQSSIQKHQNAPTGQSSSNATGQASINGAITEEEWEKDMYA